MDVTKGNLARIRLVSPIALNISPMETFLRNYGQFDSRSIRVTLYRAWNMNLY